MKKINKLFVLAIASMAALASCQKAGEIDNNFQPKVLKAVFEDGLSKTVLAENFQIQWSESDAITGFDLDGTNHTSTSTKVSEDKLQAAFTFKDLTIEDDLLLVMYPADSKASINNTAVISTTLPEVQNAVAGSFDPKANLALADGGVENVKFLNGGALLAFDIKNDNIAKIELESASSENFAGPAFLNFDADNMPLLQSTYASDLHKVTLQGNFEKGKTYYAVVFPSEYSSLKMVFTRNDGKTATYTNSNSLSVTRNSITTIWKGTIDDSKWEGGATVHDVLTSSDFPATTTTYVNFTDVRKNTAIYAGNSSLNGGISLRSTNSNSGVVSTTSGGKIKSVSVKWNSGTANGRTLDVYGSNAAYSAASDLYNSSKQGTKLGSIVIGTSTRVSVTDDYAYVGIRSNSGALILDEIDFEWADGGTPSPTKYTITVADGIVGGTITASATEAVQGTEITLTATPSTGYEFESWNVTGATVADATSATTTFTMPAADVNVSATFKRQGDFYAINLNNSLYGVAAGSNPAEQSVTTSDGITVISGCASTASNKTYYAVGHIRYYADSYLNLIAPDGYEFVKVVFTPDGTWNGGITPSVGSYTDSDKTWSGSSDVIDFSFSNQCRVSRIDVTLGKSSVIKYSINCQSVSGGIISASPLKAAEGETVTLTATPDTGYEFVSWAVTNASTSAAITVSEDNKFTMPAANVNVSATFKTVAIPDKTIAEFIVAKGGNCYLTGVVSSITNTTYGNYTLTDASGSIIVYGTLNQGGEPKKFAELGIIAGDKIKVLASEYELYGGTTDEAKNVIFVEIVEHAPKYAVNIASGIANGTVTVDFNEATEGQTVTITATPASGYKVKSVSAKKTASGTALTVTANKFTMPAEAVTVSAEFEEDGGSKAKDYSPKYSLNPIAGSNNSYTGNCDVIVNGITWNVTGNAQQVPWRLGGKSISNTDRAVYSKTAYAKDLWKVSLTVGSASSITVNSLKLVYSTKADFSDAKEMSGTFSESSTIDFEGDFPANCYYKFVFNLTVSGTTNRFVQFSKVEFFGYNEN